MQFDPKWFAAALPVLALVGAFIWRAGKKSVSAGLSEEIRQAQADLVTAHATPDPADDAAVEEKIKAKQRLKAMIDALPDTV